MSVLSYSTSPTHQYTHQYTPKYTHTHARVHTHTHTRPHIKKDMTDLIHVLNLLMDGHVLNANTNINLYFIMEKMKNNTINNDYIAKYKAISMMRGTSPPTELISRDNQVKQLFKFKKNEKGR